jgi:RNA polymerase sigma-70 factor (ECF subfamily)
MDQTPLVEKSKSGDTEAYGRLVERYQDYVFAICMAYLRQRDLAEDAAQEVFLAAFQGVRKLQDASRFQAWLKRMAINRCLDELRRNRKHLVSSIDELRESELLQSARLNSPMDDSSMEQELMVYTGLFLLESPERRVLTLHHLYGLGIPPIAEMLGISVAAAKKRLERARKALREEMTKMDAKLAIGKGFSKKVVELISRPDLVSTPGNPVYEIWSEIRKLLPDFQVVEGDEVIERGRHPEFFELGEGFMRIDLDKDRALRAETTSSVLEHLKAHPDQPCRIITAGRVWRDDEEDKTHLKMFHQLDICMMGTDVRQGDLLVLVTELMEKLFPKKAIRWELRNIELVKRCWVLCVEESGQFSEVCAGGEYRSEIVQRCGIDPTRFSAVGMGLGLERLAMLRYGIDDIRTLHSAK